MDEVTYSLVKQSVRSLLNINLDYYKDQQVRRRLDYWLIRCNAADWPAYFQRLSLEPAELGRFRDYLTINVSKFFRDPERWEYLEKHILPGLVQEVRPASGRLHIWSAGCSIGAEPYTLAMLLHERAAQTRCDLLATDLDRGALARARAGGPYSEEDIQNVSPARRGAYFKEGGAPFFVAERLRQSIRFQEHDMVAEPFQSGFDLIVCRNVVIYFTAETKLELYRKFHQALRPGGILFLGGTEIIPQPHTLGFANLGISMYRRD